MPSRYLLTRPDRQRLVQWVTALFVGRLYALFDPTLSDAGFSLDQLRMKRTRLFCKVKSLTGVTAYYGPAAWRVRRPISWASRVRPTSVRVSGSTTW